MGICFISFIQVSSYGLDDRDEVHELEFLSLLAFLAREAISSKHMNLSKAKKFSANDLEMAYAFHNKFGTSKPPTFHVPPRPEYQQKQQSPNRPPHYSIETSPQHVLNTSGQKQQDLFSAGQGHMQLGQSTVFHAQMPMRDYRGHGESLSDRQQQHHHLEAPGHGGNMLHQSSRYSGQVLGGSPTGQPQSDRDEQRMSMLLAANEHHLHSSPPGGHMTSPEHDRKLMPMQLYPQETERQSHQPHQNQGSRDMLDSSRTSGERDILNQWWVVVEQLVRLVWFETQSTGPP
jgi:hypothetical protein